MRFLLFLSISFSLFASTHSIRILDKETLLPIENATISGQFGTFTSDTQGCAVLDTAEKELFIKACGYRQQNIDPAAKTVFLQPFVPKALYLSFWAASSEKRLNRILELAEKTEINTVIVDVKNEYGDLLYKSRVARAEKIGAHKNRTVYNIEKFIALLKQKNLYIIGRVVVFKDERLAQNRHDLALKDANGTIWRNHEKLAWVDPFETEVHQYVSAIAADAASIGFDEINFDYVRFPLRRGLSYREKLNQKNRVNAISEFLKTANEALRPYNVYTSVDTYGYVCWNDNDTNIGHTVSSLAKHCDYIAPMLYPSGFGAGILGFKDPTDHPYEIINASINEALKKADVAASRFRPWLQSFKDYGFDRKSFRSKEVSEQIKGAQDALCSGWMLWNPSSRFTAQGLQDSTAPYPVLPAYKDASKQVYCFRNEKNRLIQ